MSDRPLVDLVGDARCGDVDAFSNLVERFQTMAFAYAVTLLRDPGLAEDACQEAFVDAFRHLHQLRDASAFPGWFRRVVHKHADRQRRSRLLADELGDLPGATDPLAALIQAEEHRLVHDGLAALPPRLRTSLTLFYGAGLSVEEIAGFLNIATSAVKKRLFDGRARLRRTIAPPGPTGSRPRDAVALLIASRTGDAVAAATILARRPDLIHLTEGGLDPGQVPDYGAVGCGFTLVQRSVYMGHAGVVEVLLRAGASLRVRTGLAPLDIAVLQDDVGMAELLLGAGAAPDGGRAGMLTPLHRAAMRGGESIARLLLAAGASTTAVGPGGRTAADWARLKGNPALALLIEEYPT